MKSSFRRGRGRPEVAATVVAACVLGILAGWLLRGPGQSADAADDLNVLARAEVERFYEATSGREDLAGVLGEAFQLIRTDGTRYDRQGYLGNPASLQSYEFEEFKATQSGDILVVTFFAASRGTIEGVVRDTGRSPRLAVFAKKNGAWKLQAFATMGLGLAGNPEAFGREAVDAWLEAVTTGDRDRISGVLAPEFQILRSNGTAFGREDYLEQGLPKIATKPEVANLVVTGSGDYVVARYELTIDATVDGQSMEEHAPRLTVFRRAGEGWLVVAHANFAALED